jgi:hypothetical protein
MLEVAQRSPSTSKAMRIDPERKLFLGLKLDAEMRRQHAEGKLIHRPAFKSGDPAHLELLEIRGDLYIGRILEGGLGVDEIADLVRNIKSIVSVTFSVPKLSTQLRIFAIERDELAAGLAAAS